MGFAAIHGGFLCNDVDVSYFSSFILSFSGFILLIFMTTA
jgi:hypothetical protein